MKPQSLQVYYLAGTGSLTVHVHGLVYVSGCSACCSLFKLTNHIIHAPQQAQLILVARLLKKGGAPEKHAGQWMYDIHPNAV